MDRDPVAKLLAAETAKLVELEELLRQRVVGQDDALSIVSHAIDVVVRSGRPDSASWNVPFMGPTGVGKTETAKALAEILFDDEAALIRIDMSEYMERHAVARLIGAPPGYVGFDEGGQLTEAVRRKPYSVILLDEVEKRIRMYSIFSFRCSMMADSPTAKGELSTFEIHSSL